MQHDSHTLIYFLDVVVHVALNVHVLHPYQRNNHPLSNILFFGAFWDLQTLHAQQVQAIPPIQPINLPIFLEELVFWKEE
jgi:hypothetical protein